MSRAYGLAAYIITVHEGSLLIALVGASVCGAGVGILTRPGRRALVGLTTFALTAIALHIGVSKATGVRPASLEVVRITVPTEGTEP